MKSLKNISPGLATRLVWDTHGNVVLVVDVQHIALGGLEQITHVVLTRSRYTAIGETFQNLIN